MGEVGKRLGNSKGKLEGFFGARKDKCFLDEFFYFRLKVF